MHLQPVAGEKKRAAEIELPVPSVAEVIERARRLRPLIREEAEEAERRGHYSARLNEEFGKAGFHRLLQPRSFGGYEFDVASFYKVMTEVSTGDPGTGWCLALGTGVALYVTSYFSEAAQKMVFGESPDFIAPHAGSREQAGATSRGPAGGIATPTEGGYLVKGTWRYCSGAPYSNFFTGEARLASEPERTVTIIVPKGGYRILDDWGNILGLRASGSNSVVIDETLIPKEFVLFESVDGEDCPDGTPGFRLHGNPMYNGSFLTFGAGLLVCTQIGAARAALEEYERIIRSSRPRFTPHLHKYEHHDWQRVFGLALSMTNAAEALLVESGEIFMEHCRAEAAGEKKFGLREALELQGIQHQAARLAWEAGLELFRSAGSSAAVNGQPMQRYFRDLSTFKGNANHQADFTATRIGQAALGLPVTG
jgi:3-hydroxy-9,10-secoandrosta-1,3,5(10)-triene-9,17-dione monooxygenase